MEPSLTHRASTTWIPRPAPRRIRQCLEIGSGRRRPQRRRWLTGARGSNAQSLCLLTRYWREPAQSHRERVASAFFDSRLRPPQPAERSAGHQNPVLYPCFVRIGREENASYHPPDDLCAVASYNLHCGSLSEEAQSSGCPPPYMPSIRLAKGGTPRAVFDRHSHRPCHQPVSWPVDGEALLG